MAATNNLIPDFDDFERYYRGEMSSAEQRSLEGRMLAEPLVAEAYEGFLAWRAGNARAGTMRADLQERLHTRVTQARRRTLPLWSYASAACVLLALFSYWFVFLRDQKIDRQKPAVAVKREEATSPKPEQAPADALTQREKPLKSVAALPAEPEAPIPAKPVPAIPPGQIPQALPEPESTLTPSVLADAEVREEAIDVALTDSTRAEKHIAQASPKPAHALAAPGTAQAVGKSMAARVRTEAKDLDTQYLVTSKPVSAKKESYSIVVSPDTLSAVPVAGWPSYRAYLDKNTGSASTTGQIVVTFVISASGTLSGFVARGPGELQKDAIRIISSGPAWAPARANGTPVTSMTKVQLQFRQSQ